MLYHLIKIWIDWGQNLEEKVFTDKANKFEQWLYYYFFDMESLLPPHKQAKNMEKAEVHATTTLVDLYNKNADALALSFNKTRDDITIGYFTRLESYVDSIYARYQSGNSMASVREYIADATPIKTELMKLFEGTTIETLKVVGQPFYNAKGWRNQYTRKYDDRVNCFLQHVQAQFGIPSCHKLKSSKKRV